MTKILQTPEECTRDRSKLLEERIQIQEALNLIHGGNPASIPFIKGSKEFNESQSQLTDWQAPAIFE
jgi:hypothetical protein